jgi:hypothetical protein
MRIILIFLWLSLPFAAAHSQDAAALANAEIGMKALLEGMRNAPGESERMDLNNRFAAALSATLEGNGAFTYPFDSLKGITRLFLPTGGSGYSHGLHCCQTEDIFIQGS